MRRWLKCFFFSCYKRRSFFVMFLWIIEIEEKHKIPISFFLNLDLLSETLTSALWQVMDAAGCHGNSQCNLLPWWQIGHLGGRSSLWDDLVSFIQPRSRVWRAARRTDAQGLPCRSPSLTPRLSLLVLLLPALPPPPPPPLLVLTVLFGF